MLIEQIIEVESRVSGLLIVRISKTGYFHDKTKIFKDKSSSEWLNDENVAESNVPWFSWPGQVTKFSSHVFDLTWSKGRDLFNWLANLEKFVLSNGSENVRNVIQIALKKPFFPKTYKKTPSSWVHRPQTSMASGGWWLRPQAPSVTGLSCTNLLITSPNFLNYVSKTLSSFIFFVIFTYPKNLRFLEQSNKFIVANGVQGAKPLTTGRYFEK